MQNDNYQTFIDAVDNNDVETVKRYLKIVDPSERNNWAIRVASEKGHTEVVKLLLSDPQVDPSAEYNYAIRLASYYGHSEVVKLLLSDHRVNPSVHDNLAIFWASQQDHIEVVRLLLQDPRVNFNAIKNEKMKQQLLKENKLRKEWISAYRSIEKISPQVTYGDKQKSQIPKEIMRNIVYQSTYQDLCSVIPGKFPPVKLLALADLLKIEYDRNTSYKELCGKVKFALLNQLKKK